MTLDEIDTFGLHILCVDDSKVQLALYRNQLDGAFTVTTAETYEEAIACLTGRRPDLIVLDMEMPRVSGLEFLDILRYTPSYAKIPVIIVSGDNDLKDIKEAFRRGAADYVRKPYDGEELTLRINRIFALLAARADAEKAAEAYPSSLSAAQDYLVRSLSDLASARDNPGTGHLRRIGLYAQELCEAAAKTPRFRVEVTKDFSERVAEMARLHDIGMVSVPDDIFRKTAPLTDREMDFVKKHTTDGARTVDMIRLSFPDYAFLDLAREIVLYHHERWDGKGYPEGRAAVAIPLSARVVAIVDAFDAMTTKRPFRDAIPLDEAFAAIEAGKGTAYDPDLAGILRFCRARFQEIADKHKD